MSAYSIATRGLAGRKVPQGVLTPMGELLFSASEPGAWYDPSDMSTLFQDSAGTVPVTAVEQLVGRILDKSGRGNHATQATTPKRPIYSRRVNLLTNSDLLGLSGAVLPEWGLTGVQPTLSVDGKPIFAQDGSRTFLHKVITPPADGGIVMTAYVRVVQAATLGELLGVNTSVFSATYFLDGEVSGYFAVVPVGEHIIAITLGVSAGNVEIRFGVGVNNTTSGEVEFLRVATCLAADAHLPYQRVTTDTDYDADPAKFPAYLRFDGVDDALQTGNIDFTGTDKMTVWAGVHKASDAAVALIAELGPGAGGWFYLAAPNSVGATFGWSSTGTAQSATTPTGYAAPKNAVLTGIGDIAGDIASLRVNGVTTTSTTDQGTGNYGTYPLYIGARAGTSLYFNGRLYSLIVRGAQSSLSQVEATELYIKQKMRLP